MRVLSVGSMYPPHDLRGGYELTWRSAVEFLREQRHSVRVLTSDYRSPEPSDSSDDPSVHRELRLYWRDHRFPRWGPAARLSIERHNSAILRRHIREFSPDVVNWWQMGPLSIGLVEQVRRAGLPAVGVVGDDWLVWGPRVDPWIRPFRRRPRLGGAVERLTGLPTRPRLGGAARWLFNSETTRRRALQAGLELPGSEVAHPGVDTSLFRAVSPREWGWRLLYVGRLDPRKGVDTAVEALAGLPSQTTLTLQGTGDAGYLEAIRDRGRALGMTDRLRFTLEPRERLPGLFTAADAVLFPVRWEEPWGLVPLEAMAVGRPVVATGTGGSGEYLRHERNCLIFEPRDSPDALAAAVRRLAEDAPLRGRLVAEGRETAARFTQEAYNRRIAAALEEATPPRRVATGGADLLGCSA